MDIYLTCWCYEDFHTQLYAFWSNGTHTNTFKFDGRAHCLPPFQWQMVCGKEAYYLQSCLLYILMKFCHGWLTSKWKGMFAGCLCYADDLALLAPSAYALRRMLKVCFLILVWNVQCRKDPVNLLSSSQIHCGWWLHRVLWAGTEILWLSLSSRPYVVMWSIRLDRHPDENQRIRLIC